MKYAVLIAIIIILAIISIFLLILLLIVKGKQKGNKRKYLRLPVNIVPDRFYAVGERDILLKNEICIKNISLGGIAIESNYLLEKDKKVFLRFKLPDNKEQIRTKGRIVWVGKDFHDSVMGIKFTKINRADKIHIKEFVTTELEKKM